MTCSLRFKLLSSGGYQVNLKPVMFVRRERSVCKMPICRSTEELETSVDWVRMKFEGGRYIPMHQ